jgi:hypothetical protein
MKINEDVLGCKLVQGIVNRPAGQSVESAALELVPNLTKRELATLTAIATDALVERSLILPSGDDLHHG